MTPCATPLLSPPPPCPEEGSASGVALRVSCQVTKAQWAHQGAPLPGVLLEVLSTIPHLPSTRTPPVGRALCAAPPVPRVLLNDSASPFLGGGLATPPLRIRISQWDKMKFTKEILIWAIFGSRPFGLLGSRAPPPPAPTARLSETLPLPLQDSQGAPQITRPG